MSRVLLTGASGFIGNRLIRHLADAGALVVAASRRPVSHRNVESVLVEGLDAERLRTALKGQRFNAIVHLAAAGVQPDDRDPNRLIKINGHLPSELVRLAADLGSRIFIMAGSNAEYAQADSELISENSSLETLRLYGATKAAGGLLAVATGAAIGVTTVNLRLFNVFGPGEAPHRLLPSLLANLAHGEVVRLSEGRQLRDFIHVDDACTAILTALDAAAKGALPTGHYNVCSGIGTSVRQFAQAVASAANADESLLQFGALPLRPDDLPRVVGDPRKFERIAGWKPADTFERSIRKAVDEINRSKQRA